MVLKTIIVFIAAFFGGYMAGDIFVRKNKEKAPPAKTDAEIRLIKIREKQEIYN